MNGKKILFGAARDGLLLFLMRKAIPAGLQQIQSK